VSCGPSLHWLPLANVNPLHPIEYLYIGGNALSGTVLTELGILTNLVEFYIVSNSISGTIPSMIGALKSLGMCSFGVAPPCYSVGTLRRF